jgi:hypothetical protein
VSSSPLPTNQALPRRMIVPAPVDRKRAVGAGLRPAPTRFLLTYVSFWDTKMPILLDSFLGGASRDDP